jgi:deoxyribose-phosphate aldolase
MFPYNSVQQRESMTSIQNIAKVIDNTDVSPLQTEKQIREFVETSLKSAFGGVCILPIWVKLASGILSGSSTTVSMVVGLHGETGSMQVDAIYKGAELGANCFDVLIALHVLKAGKWDEVRRITRKVINAAEPLPVKMILETGCLTDEEIVRSSNICLEEGAAYIKTSTGMYAEGASIKAVHKMREIAGDRMGVKASGGIRTYEQALAMLNAGACRIGSSTGLQILKGEEEAAIRRREM